MTKRDETGLELAADIISGLKKDLELAREAAKRTFCPSCAGMTRKQIAEDADQSLALVIADLTLRAEVAEAEQKSLRAHLTYAETRRCRHEISERADEALKEQISGLLSQVRDLDEERKELYSLNAELKNALVELVRRAHCPDFTWPSGSGSTFMFQQALKEAEAVLAKWGRL